MFTKSIEKLKIDGTFSEEYGTFRSLCFLLYSLVPRELQQLLLYVESTSKSYKEILSSFSIGPSASDSIWGVICKKIYGRNSQAQRKSIYLKWKNNSHNIRELIERIINPPISSHSSIPSRSLSPCLQSPQSTIKKSLVVSFSCDSFSVEKLPSLQTATIYRDVTHSMESASTFHCPDDCEDICWDSIERNLLDDRLMLIWSSAASDLSHYHKLKDEDYRIDFSGCNDSGKIFYYYYNSSQAQLWVDGCNFYHYKKPTSYGNFFFQCNSFVNKFSNYEYEHEIIEQTTLLLIWIVLHKIDCKSTNLFKKKYLLLTKDQLSMFINWILELRD